VVLMWEMAIDGGYIHEAMGWVFGGDPCAAGSESGKPATPM